MDHVAKDQALALSSEEMSWFEDSEKFDCKFHPHYHGICTINVFNALTMVYEYAAKVMRQEINVDDLLEFGETKEILRVVYPSPDGLQTVEQGLFILLGFFVCTSSVWFLFLSLLFS